MTVTESAGILTLTAKLRIGRCPMDYTNSQIKALIVEHIHSQRDRKILYRRLVDGITYERLAEEFQLSVSQIKRIIYKGEEQLFKHFSG
jgi:AraC-like DNA-binding protein